MHAVTYADWPSYPVVFLVPSIRKDEIRKEYLDAFGIPSDDVKVIALYHGPTKKTSVGEMKQWITEELVPALGEYTTKYVAVADAGYFKTLTGLNRAEPYLGYVCDALYGPWKVVYVPNYRTIFHDPIAVRTKISQAMVALMAHINGVYEAPGSDIVKFAAYPRTPEEIEAWLDKLLAMNCDLAIDIETFDLKHHKAGIGTITFCWSKTEGVAFPVDYEEISGATEAPFGRQVRNKRVRGMLRRFFREYTKKAIYHNIAFDVYVLVYQLFMVNLLDTYGLLDGMRTLLRNWDDTKLIAYLATNSCAGNKLSLKDQAQEFAGNYAQTEIADITQIPLDKLLRYNLIDGLSTWYVHEKRYSQMVTDQQLDIYENLFKPAIPDIIQMQLTGLPLNMVRVKEVKAILQGDQDAATAALKQTAVVQQYTYRMNEAWVADFNATRKKKRVTLADAKEEFNPNSGPQLQDLLYEMLGLPVLDLTDSKQPATGRKTLEKLLHHTSDPDVLAFLHALLDYASVTKILTGFIPAFEAAPEGPDGWHYLFGKFNLGGTVSARLSSNDPNLQNLPANGKYAILIKSCFQAPPGWVLCGLDFNALEDRISALTTKDPNKLKVYTDGYDGHCLRAFAYFRDQMPDIVDTVESINSIEKKYKDLRKKSKPPTFALTYQGTFLTLMNNCGFSEELAKQVEARYHQLYQVSDQWVADKLNQAAKDGYVTVAFGLRVRTPKLQQVILGNSKTPFEAAAEGRTAGNACGQSWGLLNTRASIEFMGIVRNGPHALDIKPCAHIHDAQYLMVRDNADALLYANKHLVKAVQWQDHPEIQHNEVHLGGIFSVFWPDWSHDIEIPNDTADEAALNQALRKRLEVCP